MQRSTQQDSRAGLLWLVLLGVSVLAGALVSKGHSADGAQPFVFDPGPDAFDRAPSAPPRIVFPAVDPQPRWEE